MQRWDIDERGDDKDPTGEWVKFGDAQAAIAAALPQWQPIETAPKDGSRLLVSEGGAVQIVAWRALHSGRENWGPDDGESVYCDGAFKPSHWMPLPTPPAPLQSHRGA